MINIARWYDRFKHDIDIKYLILLTLAGLHYHKKITDEKLKGQFQALRNGTLQKFKKTYHCDINDRWYTDEPAYEVFSDCIVDKYINTIPYADLLKYIQLFEGKNYNHALNIFGGEYIYRMLNYWNPEYHGLDFTNFIDFYVPGIVAKDNSSYCYECGSSHTSYDKNIRKNIEILNQWIHNQKKGNLKKILLHDVSKHLGSWWPN